MKIMKDEKREVRAWTDGPKDAPRCYIIVGEREIERAARKVNGRLIERAKWGEEVRIGLMPNELRIILRAYDEGRL